jgi:hypothetical protein
MTMENRKSSKLIEPHKQKGKLNKP